MGSSKAADDYKELELYLQQAEEEIGITLSQVKSTEIKPIFTNNPGNTGSQNSNIAIPNRNLQTSVGYVDLNEQNYDNLKILSTGIIENYRSPFNSQNTISRIVQPDSRTCAITSSEDSAFINTDTINVNKGLQLSFSNYAKSHEEFDNKENHIFGPEFTEVLNWSCDDIVTKNSAFSRIQNENKSGVYCSGQNVNGRNGMYDNLFQSVKEFVPLDDMKGQRPRYKSETCMEISVTGNPRKRSKSESYVEKDGPMLFITGKHSGKCSSEQKFVEDFHISTFDLDTDNSDGSITPVFSLESFIDRCNSPNLVSESCLDRSNTPVCVQENSDFDRSDTPTFIPSVDKTEKLICSTLSKCKQLRRSKTDPGFDNSLKYSFRKYCHHDPFIVNDFNYEFGLERISLRSSVSSSPGEFFHKYETENREIYSQPKRKLSTTGVQTSFDENCNEIQEKEEKLGLKKLLLKVSTGTNTTDSLERPKKKVNEKCKMSEIENKQTVTSENKENVVASVHSSESHDIIQEIKKPTLNSSHETNTQSPVKKPTSFPSELVTNMSSFLNDESPEMQVIVNATSPVLFRRRSSNNFRTYGKFQVQNVDDSLEETSVSPDTKENLFMDPNMSKTWHGITSNRWKTYYGPIMRNMLQEINNNGNTGSESENGDINQSLQYNASSLRAKTLLDEMHKKYCAYQYKNRLQLPSPDDLILPLKLKSSPPPPNRMLSRSWIFRKYAVPTNTPSPSPSPESPENSKSTAVQQSSSQLTENKDGSREATELETKHAQPKQKLNAGKEDAEIEAVEACRWLKEAGFPQYSQMYDDGQFPVDISSVEKDHDFLDKDSMQPLIRRLSTLNKCAIMRISTPTRKNAEDSDDDDQCALSDKWKYQHNIRRWSRKDLNSPSSDGQPNSPVVKSSSSNDSLLTEQNSSSETGDSPVLESKMLHNNNATSDDFLGVKTSTPVDSGGGGTSSLALSPRLRRAASERLKGAKNFLKRVESFKSRKIRKIPRTASNVVEISGPVVTDSANMQEKIKHLNCRDLSPSSEEPPSPIQDIDNKNKSTISAEVSVTGSDPVPEPWSDDSTNYKLPTTKIKTMPSSSVSCHALSDSLKNMESQSLSMTSRTPVIHNGVLSGSTGSTPHLPTWRYRSSSEYSDLFILPTDYKPGSFPRDLEDYDDAKCSHRINHRTGSFNLGHEVCDVNSNTVVKRRGSMDPKLQAHRHSIYDNVPIEENLEAAQEDLDMILYNLFQDINGLNKTIYGDDAEVLTPPSSIFNTTNSKADDNDESIDADDSLNGNDQENDVISGTVSSPDSSDHDIPVEDLSHDDSGDHIVYRERRDSGVGSSLTRAPSDKRRYRIRWHSFQKSHRPSIGSRNLQITSLSVCQLMVLQKLSLCRLTGLIEKYSPNRSNWTWTVPRFMKRHKVPDYSVKNIFGVPLLVTLQRTGQPLPQCILHAMRYLRKTAGDAVGIFRKSGVRSRIQKLKNDVEENAELVNFEELQAYDVADLVKQYFRELPECLLTNKLSEIFFNIFIYVPVEYRVDALQSAIFLLPDENREVLQSLLLFLGDIARHDAEHQMTASNLAVCFAPSLFNMSGMKSATQSPSPRRPRKNLGVPDARELQEQKAAQDCLTTMIKECKQIFMIPVSLMGKCRFSYIEQGDPVSLDEFYKKSSDDEQGYQTYVDNSIQGLLKESREKSRGWISTSLSSAVDVSYKKVADGHPLRLWKCCIDVEAPPEIVLDRIKNERHTWDEDMMNWRSIEKLDNETEIFQYVCNSMAPHPSRDYCVLRCWKTDLAKGACALISTSVEHPKAELLGGIRAVELASHYLIEPCGTGKSRITHMCRLDMRGRTPEWYKKAFGHICANSLERIQDSFKQSTEGPESTV